VSVDLYTFRCQKFCIQFGVSRFVYSSVSVDLRVMPQINRECSEIQFSLKVVIESLPCFKSFFSPPLDLDKIRYRRCPQN